MFSGVNGGIEHQKLREMFYGILMDMDGVFTKIFTKVKGLFNFPTFYANFFLK